MDDPRLACLGEDARDMMQHASKADVDTNGDTSDSGWSHRFCKAADRDGAPPELIKAIIIDKRWAVSAYVLKSKNPGRKADREIASAMKANREFDEQIANTAPEHFAKLNEQYFFIKQFGNKCAVGQFRTEVDPIDNIRKEKLLLVSPAVFALREPEPYVSVPYSKSPRGVGEAWVRCKWRREYEAITFIPGGEKIIDGKLSLWQGWGVEPKKGDWSRMRDHIYEVMASGDQNAGDYIMKCFARKVQHPAGPFGVALAWRSDQGAGKGIVLRSVKRMFGAHGRQISDCGKALGRFNSILVNCCFMYMNEATVPSKEAQSKLKSLITDPTMDVEFKGVDTDHEYPNSLFFVIDGNPEHILSVEQGDRRLAIFEASDRYKEDYEYFSPLYEQFHHSTVGISAMLYDLLDMPLGDWKPFPVWKNAARTRQQSLSLTPPLMLVERLLADQQLPGPDRGDPDFVRSHIADSRLGGLFDEPFKRSVNPELLHTSDRALALVLKKFGARPDHDRADNRGWRFLSPRECRALWETAFPGWQWDDETRDSWLPQQNEADNIFMR
jgi:Mesyanzhinovviridae DNA primase